MITLELWGGPYDGARQDLPAERVFVGFVLVIRPEPKTKWRNGDGPWHVNPGIAYVVDTRERTGLPYLRYLTGGRLNGDQALPPSDQSSA